MYTEDDHLKKEMEKERLSDFVIGLITIAIIVIVVIGVLIWKSFVGG